MLPDCATYFPAELPSAPSSFTVKGKLTGSTNYKWVLTDKFNKQLIGLATSDTAGTIVISDSSLPNLMRSFSGTFFLQAFKATSATFDQFTMCDEKLYDAISITLYDWSGQTPSTIIGNCS